jgi:hypothetical protein
MTEKSLKCDAQVDGNMTKTRSLRLPFRAAALAAVLLACANSRSDGNTTLFFEDFDSLPLQTSVSYNPPVPNAFTHTPPAGWIRDASGVPGVGDPDLGVFEWEGWSFARKDFWIDAAAGRRREFFLGKNTVAVADPAEWNDLGNPANKVGFYDTHLSTPFINYANSDDGARKLTFDSSWFPQCCDDGEDFDPDGNNQTAIVRLRFPNGTAVEVLRWESAPFFYIDPITLQQRPSMNPAHTPNPYFKSVATNEKVLVDLSPFLQAVSFTHARIEFSLINAGDDGWWAFDSAMMFSLSLIPGDMNIDGLVNEQDVSAFALGVQNPIAYSNTYFGEFPVTRGSPDGTFDFDDIPWFVDLLDSSGVASAAQAVQAAIAGIPEPSTLGLSLVLFSGLSGVRQLRSTTRPTR